MRINDTSVVLLLGMGVSGPTRTSGSGDRDHGNNQTQRNHSGGESLGQADSQTVLERAHAAALAFKHGGCHG